MNSQLQQKDEIKSWGVPIIFSNFFIGQKRIEAINTIFRYVSLLKSFVDFSPQKIDKLNALESLRRSIVSGDFTVNKIPAFLTKNEVEILINFCRVAKTYAFEEPWIRAIHDSATLDYKRSFYQSEENLLVYMYGASEVIGLMLTKIFELPKAAMHPARMQARLIKMAHNIKNIDYANRLGRIYFPINDLETFGLENLTRRETEKKQNAFREFVNFEVRRIRSMQAQVSEAQYFLPYRSRILLKTISDISSLELSSIAKNPYSVYKKKIQTSKIKIFSLLIINAIRTI